MPTALQTTLQCLAVVAGVFLGWAAGSTVGGVLKDSLPDRWALDDANLVSATAAALLYLMIMVASWIAARVLTRGATLGRPSLPSRLAPPAFAAVALLLVAGIVGFVTLWFGACMGEAICR